MARHARRWGGQRRRHAKILEERDPSLINLPFPIPVPIASIPILGPLLSPLIGGEPWPSATSTQAQEPQPTTTQVQTSPAAAPSSSATQDPATPDPAPQSSTPSAPEPTNSSGNQSGSGGSSSNNESGGDGSSGATGSSGAGSGQTSGGGDGNGQDGGGDSGSGGESGSGSDTNSSGDGGGGGGAGKSPTDGSSSSSGGTDPANAASGGSYSVNTGSDSSGSNSADSAGSSGSNFANAAGYSGSTNSANGTLEGGSFTTLSGTGGDVAQNADGVYQESAPGATSIPEAVANLQGGNVISGSSGSSGSGFIAASHTGTLPSTTAATASPSGTSLSPGQSSGSSSGSSSSKNGGPENGNQPPSSSGSGSSISSSDSHHGLSQGAIAAIATVVVVLFLLLVFFFLRKRAKSQRQHRRRRWFFGGEKTVYGNAAISSSRYFANHPNSSNGSTSQRSSFATGPTPDDWETFVTPASSITEASMPPGLTSARLIAPPTPSTARKMEPKPEMEQVWPSNLSGSIAAPALATTVDSEPIPTIRSPDRTSWESSKTYSDDSSSNHSTASDWLTIPNSAATHDRSPILPSPMSVRPFSPSEAWQFPKPPQDWDRTDLHRSRTSPLMVSPDSLPESAESSDYATAPENPFSDFASAEDYYRAESVLSADTDTASHFARVETIRRPFVPTMDDEMATIPGESVRMLRRFDDGWAYAEKVPTGQRGLIPIDCLRMPEEELPAFLAAKRLSSYRGARSPSPLRKGRELSEDTMVVEAI